jgi:hypothetical protein
VCCGTPKNLLTDTVRSGQTNPQEKKLMNQNELEKIIGFGRLEKEFTVFKFKVLLRTLTSQEISEIMQSVSGYDDVAKVQTIQIKTLARSIVAMNGKPIEYVPEDENEQITSFKKYVQNEKIIGKWERIITDAFYSAYVDLLGEQSDFLSQFPSAPKKTGAGPNG